MNTKILRDPLPGVPHLELWGLGVSGAALTHLLHAFGRTAHITDERPASPLPPLADGCTWAAAPLPTPSGAPVVLAPSLNPEWPENRHRDPLRQLRERAIPTWAEVDLAATAWPGPLLAVGGTDGKSTTVALAHHLLAALGRPTSLGGNSWTPLSTRVLELDRAGDPHAVLCAEVSAFQSWQPLRMRPHAAILTNIAHDHLDHYDSFDDYARAKRRLLDALEPGRTAVLYAADSRLRDLAPHLRERGVRVVWFSERAQDLLGLPDEPRAHLVDGALHVPRPESAPLSLPADALRIPGEHNLRNALAALAAVASVTTVHDADLPALVQGLRSFAGLPHRLQLVADVGDVTFVDDSKATNVHAACTGLRSLSAPAVVLTGGVDKGLDLEPWLDALAERSVHTLVIGELRERLGHALQQRGLPFERAATLDDAVRLAHRAASQRGAAWVLFAPAASSFDMFPGFEARGQAFQRAVRALAD